MGCVAERAREGGWEVPTGYNVVSYSEAALDALEDGFGVLCVLELRAQTRSEARRLRSLMWRLANELRLLGRPETAAITVGAGVGDRIGDLDLREQRALYASRFAAAADGLGLEDAEAGLFSLYERVRCEMALLAPSTRFTRRSESLFNAMDRLLTQRPGRDGRERVVRERDTRGELRRSVFGFREREQDGTESGEGSGEAPRARRAKRATGPRSRATGGRPDELVAGLEPLPAEGWE